MKLFKKSKKEKREPYKIEDTIQIKHILRKFESDNHYLNLENINLNNIQDNNIIINNVIERINNNKNIFYVQKYNLLKKILPQEDLQRIQRILINNKFNYEKYPNDYIHCLIANHSYCFKFNFKTKNTNLTDKISGFSENYLNKNQETNLKKNIIDDDELHCDCVWNELLSRDWVIYSIKQTHGYKSITYLNDNTKQIVVAYQGMKFKFEDFFVRNPKSYIESLNFLIKNQHSSLIENVNKSVELSNRLNYSLSFTGYSFGSIFAQLSLFMCHKYLNITKVKAVVFESIGLHELFNELNNETNNNKINLDDLEISTYVLYPSFFNTINKHVGKIISSYKERSVEHERSNYQIFIKYRETIFKRYKIHIIIDKIIHRFYLSGLKSLVSYNLKLLLNYISSNVVRFVDSWPVNYKTVVLNKVDMFPDFISKILFIIFEKSRNIKKKSYSDYNIKMNYDLNYDVYDKKELLCSNDVEIYLDKISQFRSVFNFKINDNDKLNREKLFIENIFYLQSKYEVVWKNNFKSIITRNSIDVNKLIETFKHMIELDSNLKNYIDKKLNVRNKLLEKKQILSQIEFYKLTNHLLEDYVHLNRFYKINKSFTIITGESGSGKSTLAAKLASDFIKFNKNTLIKWIDCSSNQNMLDDFMNFVNTRLYTPSNSRTFWCVNYLNMKYNYENFYYNLVDLTDYLYKKRLNVVFILDNLSRFHYLNYLFGRKDSYLKVIVTSNNFKQEKQGKFLKDNYNFIKLDKLNKIECNSMLVHFNHYFDEFLSNSYSLNTFIDELLKNEDDNKILIYKMRRLLNIFKSAKTKFKTIDEIMKCNDDILHFIQNDKKSAFQLLIYITFYLDRNNLRVDLLKYIYRLINNYELDFELDESFNTNFNQDIEYLINMSVVTRIDNNNYIIHDFVKIEFKNLRIIDFEDELRVFFTNHLALNQLFRLNFLKKNKKWFQEKDSYSITNMKNKIFYEKQYYSISNKYRRKKLKKYFSKFNSYKIFCENIENSSNSSNILKLTLNEVDNFIHELKQSEFTKLYERKILIEDELNQLIVDLKDGLDIIYEEISKLKNETQLVLEEKIVKAKEINLIDKNIDENELDPLENKKLLVEINILKEKANEDFEFIEKYHKDCDDSFKKRKDERNSIDNELKHILEMIDYFFKLKNVKFSNLKIVNEIFINLESDIFKDTRNLIHNILFINESHLQNRNYFKIGNIILKQFESKGNKTLIDKDDFVNDLDLSDTESISSMMATDISGFAFNLQEDTSDRLLGH